MRCIFCKIESSNTKSIEHIIPESLGNKSHVLPKGTVCDRCNNYFATKIEKNVLELDYFKSLRSRNEIFNKKGKVPNMPGLVPFAKNGKVEISIDFINKLIGIVNPTKEVIELIESGKANHLLLPILEEPEVNNYYMSRFIGKVALEALAQTVNNIEGWNDDFVDNISIDPLRNYVRFGRGFKYWPYHQRKIYNERDTFTDFNNPNKPHQYQVLFEYDFHITNEPVAVDEQHYSSDQIYFVCAIMGIEYSINISSDTTKHYLEWIDKNKGISPLAREYQKRNTQVQ